MHIYFDLRALVLRVAGPRATLAAFGVTPFPPFRLGRPFFAVSWRGQQMALPSALGIWTHEVALMGRL